MAKTKRGRPKGKDWALFTAKIPVQLLSDFKRACLDRGHQQTWVIVNAMAWFVKHPRANGWSKAARVYREG